MSRRNTRQDKARRRAERDRRRGTATSGQGPQAVEVQAVEAQAFLVAPRPGGSGSRNPGERGSGLRSDPDRGSIAVEPGEADLDTHADPGDFDGLDADDAGLQAPLTVLAVLEDDISHVAEGAADLVGAAHR